MIIATAGHVDHGKTELIKALTGVDTDRLPEEKSRGLSIDLGFAFQTLEDDLTLGFVDVPGHEKFIRNMLAGVGGIDLGLLVIAADDGVMPQTREHFAILNLLGIDQFVVAITKIDRVDDDQLLNVQAQVETLLQHEGLNQVPVFPLCAPCNEGIEPLKQAICEQAKSRNIRSTDGYFRMAIDRAFTLKGIGLVVTGMVLSGSANIDDKVLISADGSSARIRGIRSNNAQSDRAQVGERCAINIAGRGVSEDMVRRGNWLMDPNLYHSSRRIDVDLKLLESETRSLKHWSPVHLHIAAERITARVAVLEGGSIEPGQRGLAQLVLDQDAFVVSGDRFVLRDQSAQRTVAGGHVVDPFSPKRGRARPERIQLLKAMNQRDPLEALEKLSAISLSGVSSTHFSRALNLPPKQMQHLLERLSLRQIAEGTSERIFSEAQWQGLLERIGTETGQFHQRHPARPGPAIKDIQLSVSPFVAAEVLQQAIREMTRQGVLKPRGSHYHLPSHQIAVSTRDQQLWDQVTPFIAPNDGSPLSLHQAAEAIGVDKRVLEAALKNAVKLGEMISVAKNRYLPVKYAARLARAAENLIAQKEQPRFSVVEFCEDTGLGRNFAIDLLEHFDRIGFTERVENLRLIRKPANTVFDIDNDI
ncbi:MAG: selenocysteine-specific translation elongation factor [Pseudomonadota bacterium]